MTAHGTAIQNTSFLILVALTTLAFLALIRNFLMPVFWAAVLATVFFPLQRRYVAGLGGRRSLAAVATILTIIGFVVAPFVLVGVAVTREAVQLHDQITSGAIDLQAPLRFLRRITPLASDYLGRFGVDLEGMVQRLSTSAVSVTQFVASTALGIGQNVLRFTALFFLMLYILFFFLRDGNQLVATMIRVLPLGDVRERQLLAKFAEVSLATIKGTLVVGIVQGAIGGGLFWALGIPAPVFWGTVMAVFSVLPVVGPGLIWGPAAIILLGLGEIVKGIIMVAAGVVHRSGRQRAAPHPRWARYPDAGLPRAAGNPGRPRRVRRLRLRHRAGHCRVPPRRLGDVRAGACGANGDSWRPTDGGHSRGVECRLTAAQP